MAIDSNTKIRLVGTQNFAYATGNSYTQGHVHFTTDEHGSIVVNGKVYGTTDASYVYVGSENIPAYIGSYISYEFAKLNTNVYEGHGRFVSHVTQQKGKITAYKNTLEDLVDVVSPTSTSSPDKAGKFIHSIEIEGDTIIPKWAYLSNNIDINIADNRSSYSYIPKFTGNGSTIIISDGTYVASYEEFKGVKDLVYTFFKDADKDAGELNEYIDTLAEIQNAFKNSYAEGISNSIKDIQYAGGYRNNTYSSWITYTTNGGGTKTAYVDIPIATKDNVGLVKYDDITIKKNSSGQLYVNGELTDTKYSLDGGTHRIDGTTSGAYIKLIGSDSTSTTVEFVGTGIANVSYNSTNKIIEINVPETVINYNHHSDNGGTYTGNTINLNTGNAYVVTNVSLTPDGILSHEFTKISHGNAGVTGTYFETTNIIPIITVNNGHVTSVAAKAVDLTHDHEEFYWL